MVWVTFVMAGYLLAHDRHIAIHVVDYFLPIRVLGVVQLLASIVVLLTCLGTGVRDLGPDRDRPWPGDGGS